MDLLVRIRGKERSLWRVAPSVVSHSFPTWAIFSRIIHRPDGLPDGEGG